MFWQSARAPISNKIPSWILWRCDLATSAITPGKGQETQTPESVFFKLDTRNDFMLLLSFIQVKGRPKCSKTGNVSYNKSHFKYRHFLMFSLPPGVLKTLTETCKETCFVQTNKWNCRVDALCVLTFSFGLAEMQGLNGQQIIFYGRRLISFWEGVAI